MFDIQEKERKGKKRRHSENIQQEKDRNGKKRTYNKTIRHSRKSEKWKEKGTE